jgi:hypothetical protein
MGSITQLHEETGANGKIQNYYYHNFPDLFLQKQLGYKQL